jgi:hypothetical protein
LGGSTYRRETIRGVQAEASIGITFGKVTVQPEIEVINNVAGDVEISGRKHVPVPGETQN